MQSGEKSTLTGHWTLRALSLRTHTHTRTRSEGEGQSNVSQATADSR